MGQLTQLHCGNVQRRRTNAEFLQSSPGFCSISAALSRTVFIMEIDAKTLSYEAAYKLMIGSVVPRPIAWLTTVSPDGIVNAAPFSAYTILCIRPPMVIVNCARRDGVSKDTARNAATSADFVLNVVSEDLAAVMHQTSAYYPPGVSETEALGIAVSPSRIVRSPRIAAAPISLECRLHQILEFGSDRDENLVGEVMCFHIADHLLKEGKI
ncbi:flavin reductase family protein [Bradyrhizobium sp. CCBAU 21359]|uniref:flavin reductase family protein n=1 Tax=Bradyrhizobium sp. CCBAU 21359 TaxID=1325080 RepID=UPI002305F0E1|nr:flavin reductase family protein [Bradyrhizobium sp. CCBAU 21359]